MFTLKTSRRCIVYSEASDETICGARENRSVWCPKGFDRIWYMSAIAYGWSPRAPWISGSPWGKKRRWSLTCGPVSRDTVSIQSQGFRCFDDIALRQGHVIPQDSTSHGTTSTQPPTRLSAALSLLESRHKPFDRLPAQHLSFKFCLEHTRLVELSLCCCSGLADVSIGALDDSYFWASTITPTAKSCLSLFFFRKARW